MNSSYFRSSAYPMSLRSSSCESSDATALKFAHSIHQCPESLRVISWVCGRMDPQPEHGGGYSQRRPGPAGESLQDFHRTLYALQLSPALLTDFRRLNATLPRLPVPDSILSASHSPTGRSKHVLESRSWPRRLGRAFFCHCLVSPPRSTHISSYFLKAIQWAKKYGIRINLDLHALPGSQNGWNHSGRLGTVNVLNGPMGVANAQRSLDYIRIIAEFISQPQYRDVVTIFGIANEPLGSTIGQPQISSLYVANSDHRFSYLTSFFIKLPASVQHGP